MFRPTSPISVAAVAIVAATAIAACGASSGNSSSSTGSGRHLSIAQMQQDGVNFADCMRSHGITGFPDPTASPRAFKQALDPSAPHSPGFTPAVTGCHHLLPGGGQPTPSPTHSHAQIAAAIAFARCMRSHGFPTFPDPDSSGDLTHEMLANAGINIHQPAAVPAADVCTSVTHGYITKAAVARFVAGQ